MVSAKVWKEFKRVFTYREIFEEHNWHELYTQILLLNNSKNVKPRSCPLCSPNPGRNQEGNILNHLSRAFLPWRSQNGFRSKLLIFQTCQQKIFNLQSLKKTRMTLIFYWRIALTMRNVFHIQKMFPNSFPTILRPFEAKVIDEKCQKVTFGQTGFWDIF